MENTFTVGGVFSRSFDILFKNLPFMLGVSLVSVLPMFLVQAAANAPILMGLGFLMYFLLSFLVQGVIVFGVYQYLTRQEMDLGESINQVLQRLGPLLLVMIVVGLLELAGFALLIIPGILLSLMFWVVIPVTLVEKVGLEVSLRRSRTLTTGYRGQIFTLSFLLFCMFSLVGLIQGGLVYMIANAANLAQGTFGYALVSLPFQVLLSGMSGILAAVVMTVGYYALRFEVEGVDMQDLESVFE